MSVLVKRDRKEKWWARHWVGIGLAGILVFSAGEIAQWKDSSHHVIARALREGKVLYESA